MELEKEPDVVKRPSPPYRSINMDVRGAYEAVLDELRERVNCLDVAIMALDSLQRLQRVVDGGEESHGHV
jgi:hypothetical protein